MAQVVAAWAADTLLRIVVPPPPPQPVQESTVKVVNVPAAGVVPPITVLLIVPPLIVGDVRALLVKVSVPAKVDKVPVIGRVKEVVPVVYPS